VGNDPEVRLVVKNARIVELMERAQAAFDRSRRLVQESRKIRLEAEARRSMISAQDNMDGLGRTSSGDGESAARAAE